MFYGHLIKHYWLHFTRPFGIWMQSIYFELL